MNIRLEDIRDDISRQVKAALKEDIGDGDITAQLIDANETSSATIITREDCTFCGEAWLEETFAQLGGLESISWKVKDGEKVKANSILVELYGNSRTLLTGERTALNFLQLLSGVSSECRKYADAVAGSDIKILDTRKTLPGLRTAQKYAVAQGSCHNHRIGLYDMFLIKENHIEACGGITQAVARAKEIAPEKLIELEVENLEEFRQGLESGVDIIMLDEMSSEDINQALFLREKSNKENIELEISGSVSLENLKSRLKSGINRISIGGLTKSINPIDLSFRIQTSN